MIALSDFRGKHEGKDIFVLAPGPSLRKFDADIVGDNPVITVNAAIIKYQNPSYYFTCDGFQYHMNSWKYVKAGSFPVLSCIGSNQIAEGIQDRLCRFERDENNGVLDNGADKLIVGICSTHCAVHFAHILGAKRIILAGCDSIYEDGRKYFYNFPGEEKEYIADGTPEQEYEKNLVSSNNSDGYLGASRNYWDNMRQRNTGIDICVYGGGVLTQFFPEYKT